VCGTRSLLSWIHWGCAGGQKWRHQVVTTLASTALGRTGLTKICQARSATMWIQGSGFDLAARERVIHGPGVAVSRSMVDNVVTSHLKCGYEHDACGGGP
jgi:hypothetical protein